MFCPVEGHLRPPGRSWPRSVGPYQAYVATHPTDRPARAVHRRVAHTGRRAARRAFPRGAWEREGILVPTPRVGTRGRAALRPVGYPRVNRSNLRCLPVSFRQACMNHPG
jgi:hypothetical protein